MSDYLINRTYAFEVEVDYTPPGVFTATGTDWYEYVENIVITFCDRLKAEIDADAKIQTYAPVPVHILLTDELKRFEKNATLKYSAIVIHSVTSGEKEMSGSGRYNRPISARITAYVRGDKGVIDGKESNVYGSSTPTRPGVLEVLEDVKALLTDNYLEVGGERYLWKIVLGEIVPEDVLNEQLKGHVAKATFTVTGHKWEYIAP